MKCMQPAANINNHRRALIIPLNWLSRGQLDQVFVQSILYRFIEKANVMEILL